MDRKFDKLGAELAKAGKNTVGLFEKAKNAAVAVVDQNDDGKIGLDDL